MGDDTFDIDIQNLKIATFNVRGMRTNLKQDALIKSLSNLKLNIIALQETHLIQKDIDLLKNRWQGPIIHSEGTTCSKGLCFLFDNYFKNIKIDVIAKNDRFLLCSCVIGNKKLYLCNVYAPNNTNEKLLFYSSQSAPCCCGLDTNEIL